MMNRIGRFLKNDKIADILKLYLNKMFPQRKDSPTVRTAEL